ncbi:adenylate cyclase [Bradyrhizobium sp. USDA 4518]|uniref:Adenylate/guanylate cyclase domain-containing protein n=1 Tax=Bradyrhizobium brasilense TaxID=1419277 RepID=A0ABY8JPR6_9BRAD|nr:MULTISPECIES: adenylate/guanylate cyclase domain-containing protein [Bradyrhizobium]OMI15216.1 adenylate/guanylate cyclase domain-containing protein [Bradyrhizobium brasilense]WFU66491.1 adenylate/guanylate cyclase domain-containing protein [Bradyrhizobium brasilense]
MRRAVTPVIVLAVFGLLVGGLFRYAFDESDEASVSNYVRSALDGAALTVIVWATHLYLAARGGWLRRQSLIVELIGRSVILAVTVAAAAIVLEIVLYGHGLEAKWMRETFLKIIGVGLLLSIPITTIYELVRMIGGHTLLSIVLGRYRQPVREERVLLFLDLVGSTTLAESMGELRVQELLTRFFFDIDEPIVSHGGEVHAYVGDEVIVTWPANADGRSRRYLDCVFAIEDRLAKRADQYRKEFGVVPAFRAGMHAGPVVIAECGDSRRQIAYFGDTVNVTARLQAHCKEAGRPLLVSGDLLRLLPPDRDLVVEPLGSTQLRGRAASIDIFSVARRVSS